MANEIQYKNLLNSFVDFTNAYALDVKNSLSEMFLTQSMGLTEEFMFDRIFTNGTIGSLSRQLVGIPQFIIDDIVVKYTTLKSSINSETTTIQTQFNTLNTNEKERLYIKLTLLNILEEQLTNITNIIMSTTNSFRQQQVNLVNAVDKLNLVTINNYDGEFLTSVGGQVKAYQLTGTTVLTTLTTDYNSTALALDNYISKDVAPTFTKNYPGGEEYLFFINRLCTNKTMAFNFIGGYKTQLVDILKYRNGVLYDKLLKIDENCVNGIRYQTERRFKGLLQTIITTWLTYDLSLTKSRFDKTLDVGYKTLENGLKSFNTTYDVGYGVNTGATAQNLVRNELKSRNVGSQTTTFNHKMIGQLYIS
tara:strand:+ start:337 stop:1425 length:1089 start_codon:yes stop_codon:yes gene_type:complete